MIVDILKKEMLNLGVNQSELARRLNQPRGTVNSHFRNWETGKSQPSLKILKKWALCLGVDYKIFLNHL